ncbi:MAG: CCA tRNA nucleotidyltransferase [Planctomycetes bacterium]|nr:CCA tRNA nucleotidyltransferase [Planctomycetota bacterium]
MRELPNIPVTRLARRVIARLRGLGHEALLAGGCVRDLLIGRTPKDYDIATSALPDQVEAAFAHTVSVGKAFGVIRVLDDELRELAVEVATFRHDGPYLDGRHPSSVSFTNAAQDAARRDFTINALFLDPETSEVHDFVGGLADLDARLIRAVGEPRQRFEEDKLRLLRAARFAATLNFEIDDATLAALTEMAAQVRVCSAERVRDELEKMITQKGASRGLRLMLQTGLMDAVLPEISAMVGVQQPPQFHPEGDVWVHTMLAMDLIEHPCTITLALGVLLHDVGKPPTFDDSTDRIRFNGHDHVGTNMTGEILTRLKFPNEVIERVQSLVADHLRFMNAEKMKTSTLKRWLRKPHFDEDLELHRIDCLAGPGTLETWHFVRRKQAEFAAQPESLRPKLPIDGNDLKQLGLPPGPRFKELLSALEDEMLEGRVATRDQAIAFVRQAMAGPANAS